MRFARHPVAAIFPGAARIRGDEPVTAKTAILVCIRNEAPDRVIRNLAPLMSGLAGAGTAERFDVYVLSDTSDPALAANEEVRFGVLAAEWRGRMAVVYRRRAATESPRLALPAPHSHRSCEQARRGRACVASAG